MKKLILEGMTLENFKGVKSLTLNISESGARIYGANGTGKSTLADAFCWTLFGKDAHGNIGGNDKFRDKPLDSDGNEVHNVDTVVELRMRLDGTLFTCKRLMRENWTRKRCSDVTTFSGNVSHYYINDVELKEADYKARIAEIAPESVFKLTATLSAFNALDWKDRRAQLMALANADIDAELLERPEYADLKTEITERNITVEDLKKVLTDRRKLLNDDLKMIPVRIDEARKSAPTLTEQEIKDAEYNLSDAEQQIQSCKALIAQLERSDESGQARQELTIKTAELESIKLAMQRDHDTALQTARTAAADASARLTRTTLDYTEATKRLTADRDSYNQALRRLDDYRSKYLTKKAEPLPQIDNICPTCGQVMPDDKLEAAAKALVDAKAAMLADMANEGKVRAQYADEIKRRVQDEEAKVNELHEIAVKAQADRDEALAALNAIPAEVDYTQNEKVDELETAIDKLRRGGTLRTSSERIKSLNEQIKDLTARQVKAMSVLSSRDAAKRAEERVAELEQTQAQRGEELTRVETLLMMIGEFTTARCDALEASINANFPTIRWKLFNVQINGGIVDTCVCMIPCDGSMVSYDCANTASQINADVEIVNVLSERYGFQPPLFVDNAERVNNLRYTATQLITLSVSDDKTLRVEEI